MPLPVQIALRTFADLYQVEDAADADGEPRVRGIWASHLPALVSNCKPSLLNVLPLRVAFYLPQKDFEPIFDGPFSASPSRYDLSAISRCKAILGTGIAIRSLGIATNHVRSNENTDDAPVPSAASSWER
jgi:hypothetical protein